MEPSRLKCKCPNPCIWGSRKLPSRRKRSGFTLVELLVTMAVTVILIFALAQAFAVVGEVVAEGRAAIEMAGSLRTVANRLQEDLAGLTVPARPRADEASGGGYLTILDGPSTDSDWNDDGVIDVDPTVSITAFGDIDDVLAFTARSQGTPFVGERAYYDAGNLITLPLESHLAEIVWWIQFDDMPNNAEGNGIYDPEESFTVYRRAMLIRPDLGQLWNPPRVYPTDNTGLTNLRDDLIWFFNHNDVSVRITRWVPSAGNIAVQLTANSLADLTRRENRFAHLRILSDRPALSLAPVAADSPWAALPAAAFPFPMDLNRRSVTSLYRAPKTGSNAGEDVMLRNALAFDVQVFDPKAPLRNSPNTGEALAPGDPGYFAGFAPGTTITNTLWPQYPNLTPVPPLPPNAPATFAPQWIGYGAFVDLGWGHGDGTANARLRQYNTLGIVASSDFAGVLERRPSLPDRAVAMHPGSRMNVPDLNWRTPTYCYDTWSMHYERDNVDRDGDGRIDQATDGFGIPAWETSPPYPVPLRGIRVTIRAIEPDQRQIQQVSVISDFLPE